ncbi:MAG: hypothetical protein K9M97_06430 [Akkermansiaceae bacterium]|nr:hypothetical protein [Akkermansiaceae bacterium]
MKLHLLPLAAAVCLVPATLRAELVGGPQEQMVFAIRPDLTVGTAWLGVEGRSYFMEWSVDLTHWHYLPMMKHGVGTHIYDLPVQTEPSLFLRLHYTDTNTTDPAGDDFDDDGLTNWAEITQHFTDPLHPDSDRDGITDGWKISHNLDPNNTADAALDPDNDGLTNLGEYNADTDPADPDSDDDGLTDGEEVLTWHTNPASDDTDGDGLPDAWEREHNLNPASRTGSDGTTGDPDLDGLGNFDEWLNGTDPHDDDSDDDGRNDSQEIAATTDPLKQDQPYIPPADPDLPIPQYEDVSVTVGDPSGSRSERWKMTIAGQGPDDTRTMSVASPGFGKTATATLRLRKWNTYLITLEHLATAPEHLQFRGGADYDWEATVDALPAAGGSIFPPPPTPAQGNSYFVIKNHWLVDNSADLLTGISEGDTQNITLGISATLVPVDIDDNQPASGVDDISCTVPEGTAGRQSEHWIMAPNGPVPEDPSWGDTQLFNTPIPSAPLLAISTLLASPDPYEVTLDPSKPAVVWKGISNVTEEDNPDWLIGDDSKWLDLPVRVKVMKKRNIRIAVFPVRSLPADPEVPLPDKAVFVELFNRVYGWQVNAWLKEEDIIYKTQSQYRYGSPEGDGRLLMIGTTWYNDLMTTHMDPAADLNLVLVDHVDFIT